jgi:hypothetical protein
MKAKAKLLTAVLKKFKLTDIRGRKDSFFETSFQSHYT